ITGHVTSDDGRALAGAAIHIFRAYASVIGPPTSISADDEGNFSASGLAPGLYSVTATVPGYVSVPGPTTSTGESGIYRTGDTVNIRLVKGGVITGTVRDSNNEPVIAVMVRATRVRDDRGRPTSVLSNYYLFRMTDDRGVYRIYGLSPGTYIVSAGGSLGFYMGTNGYDTDSPTYYPSSTRDTAAEIPVHAGDEATNIDIRYRGDHGHTISGTINALASDEGPLVTAINLTLRQASNGAIESTSFIMPGAKPTFALQGIADGTYDLTAQQVTGSGNSAVSTPRRITVKGMDVTGVELILTPLGSIAGRATLEPAPNKEGCTDKRPATLIETLISARTSEKSKTETLALLPFTQGGGSALTDQGEFTIRNLNAGTYRLTARLPTDRWYIRSILLRSAPAARTSTAPSKSVAAPPASSIITLKAGENFTGASLAIAQDGATVRGRIEMTKEGAEAAAPAIPADLKIFLVPAEKERADDVLRYAEVKPDGNGQFTIKNLAPGRYLVIARSVVEDTSPELPLPPLAWDADARAKLRHDAEAAKVALELQPCQRVIDYVLKYPNVK
ncbi:MAG TPA: carboxypeptidase-like regulatory domain-containing protein, partial [Pyrinomonadaceae bacterium]|nr:carboxypeptidase-like regulatory domain-containing protein [Pyrinomonadaceae bacterium]